MLPSILMIMVRFRPRACSVGQAPVINCNTSLAVGLFLTKIDLDLMSRAKKVTEKKRSLNSTFGVSPITLTLR